METGHPREDALTGRFFEEKAPRPRRGGGGDGLGGARSPGETTSLVVALRPSIDRDEGPHPTHHHPRPYGDEGPSPQKTYT